MVDDPSDRVRSSFDSPLLNIDVTWYRNASLPLIHRFCSSPPVPKPRSNSRAVISPKAENEDENEKRNQEYVNELSN